MNMQKQEFSFVAKLECISEGFEGHVGFDRVTTFVDGNGEEQPDVEPVMELTVTHYLHVPGFPAVAPYPLRFNAFRNAENDWVFCITAPSSDGDMQLVADPASGTIVMQRLSGNDGDVPVEFWHLRSSHQAAVPAQTGEYKGVWLERYVPAGERGERGDSSGQLPGRGFYVGKRSEGKYWSASFTARKEAAALSFLGNLHVTEIIR